MYRYLLLCWSLLVVSFSINAMPVNEVNTWYAGTPYTGTVTTGRVTWECGGGTCVLNGPYGRGLSMDVCKSLARQVGGLEYYYNDAGMSWSKTKSPDLLAQCNQGAYR